MNLMQNFELNIFSNFGPVSFNHLKIKSLNLGKLDFYAKKQCLQVLQCHPKILLINSDTDTT